MGEPDEQTVLDHPGNAVKTLGERFRIGDPLECGIQYLVPSVRDESVAVLGTPQQRGTGATNRRGRRFDRPPRRA